ncbi:MAG: Uma2 family endonuclease [Lachnospiraceae bacterium]|nr:Uma2 family endonuclease [Lachnospiraceae bacterium]
MEIMDDNRVMTEADYYALPDERRVELIDGVIYDMASPGVAHQKVLGKLYRSIADYIDSKDGKCEIIFDLDTRLDTAKDTIVRPDLSIICEPDKLTKKRCEGSPDWIIEIVSPSNPRNDYLRKLDLYQRVGVKEYWIVDPMKKRVIVYSLEKDAFEMTPYNFRDKIKAGIYDDLTIDFAPIDDMIS